MQTETPPRRARLYWARTTTVRVGKRIIVSGGQTRQKVGQLTLKRVGRMWPATILTAIVQIVLCGLLFAQLGVVHPYWVEFFAVTGGSAQIWGHWLTMRRHHQPARIVFLLWLTQLIPANQKWRDEAPRWHEATVALAGPLINVTLSLIGLVIVQLTSWSNPGTMMIGANAGIACLSLLPLPFMDGGRLLHNVLASVNTSRDQWIEGVITGSVFVSAVYLFAQGHVGPYPLLALIGVHWTRKQHPQQGYLLATAMNRKQVGVVLLVWLTAFGFSLYLCMTTPPNISATEIWHGTHRLTHVWRQLP